MGLLAKSSGLDNEVRGAGIRWIMEKGYLIQEFKHSIRCEGYKLSEGYTSTNTENIRSALWRRSRRHHIDTNWI